MGCEATGKARGNSSGEGAVLLPVCPETTVWVCLGEGQCFMFCVSCNVFFWMSLLTASWLHALRQARAGPMLGVGFLPMLVAYSFVTLRVSAMH